MAGVVPPKGGGGGGGVHERGYSNEGAPPSIAHWRNKLCSHIRKDINSRLESSETKGMQNIFATKLWGSRTDTELLAFAKDFGGISKEDELYEILSEWRALQASHREGDSAITTMLKYLKGNESNGFSLLIEALISCHPSSVICERCFSFIVALLGKQRTSMDVDKTEEQLIIRYFCPTDMALKKEFALEVAIVFLTIKSRRWKQREKSGETRNNATMLWEDLCDMDVEVSENESDASSQVSDLVDFMSEEESEDSADKLVRNTLKRKGATSDQSKPTKKQKQEDKSQPSLKSFFSQRD